MNGIVNGDALKVLKEYTAEGNKWDVDIVFTSPPYNIGGNNGFYGERKAVSKYRENNDNIQDGALGMKEIILLSLECSKYFFLNVQKTAGNKKEINKLLYLLNDFYCDEIIINKNNGIPNGVNERVMTNCIEYIYIFSKKPSRAVGTKKGRGNVKNVLNTTENYKNEFSKNHNAVMPLEGAEWVINNFTNEGDTVMDPFAGIFTTGVACKKMGRNFIGIEQDKEYFALGEKRLKETQYDWSQHNGEKN